jgi:hypothetical protein
MLFFRAEDHIQRWCSSRGSPLRPIVNLDQLWFLSTTWYGNRLTAESRRPKPSEMTEIFGSIGLHGDFWDPTSDRF